MMRLIIGGSLDLMKWGDFISILCPGCSESLGQVCTLPFSHWEVSPVLVDFPHEAASCI